MLCVTFLFSDWKNIAIFVKFEDAYKTKLNPLTFKSDNWIINFDSIQ